MADNQERKSYANFVDFMKKKSEQKEEEAKPQHLSDAEQDQIEAITDMIRKKIQSGK